MGTRVLDESPVPSEEGLVAWNAAASSWPSRPLPTNDRSACSYCGNESATAHWPLEPDGCYVQLADDSRLYIWRTQQWRGQRDYENWRYRLVREA